MNDFRTDMADERREVYKAANKLEGEIPGIKATEKIESDTIKSNIVEITSKDGEKAIGKPIGKYITYDLKDLEHAEDDKIEKTAEIISAGIAELVDEKVPKHGGVLVVGLGNQFVTPDALGPKVISEIEITRHLIKYAPQYVVKGARSVCAVAPGVLGTTGIETVEIIKGIVENVKPKLVIAIDSLASRSISRISRTIQISNTGITPGAGVENTRKELSSNTLGVPVIAIGVPMVVDLATITDDCLNMFIGKLQDKAESNDYLNSLKAHSNYEEIKSALVPNDYNMIVTPKEIDDLVENMKNIIARSINYAL